MDALDPPVTPGVPQASPVAVEPSLATLSQAYGALRIQFQAVLLTLVVLNLGLNLFLYRQVSLVRREVRANGPAVERLVAEFVRTGEPTIRRFLVQLQAFSKTHPDFRPVLARYVNPAGEMGGPPPVKHQPRN